MMRLLFLAALFAALCQPAFAADAQKKQMIQAYSADFPDAALMLVPLLLRNDTGANVTVAELYLRGGMCEKADYWLEQTRQGSDVEYAEMAATAEYNGDCRKENKEKALQLFQQCFEGNLSCGRKLLEAAEALERGELALETAKKLSEYGDETGLSTLYFYTVNGRYAPKNPEQAYYIGLLAMRSVSDPELRNVFVATNDGIAKELSEEKKKEILARADAWKPLPLPDSMEEFSKSSGVYVLK